MQSLEFPELPYQRNCPAFPYVTSMQESLPQITTTGRNHSNCMHACWTQAYFINSVLFMYLMITSAKYMYIHSKLYHACTDACQLMQYCWHSKLALNDKLHHVPSTRGIAVHTNTRIQSCCSFLPLSHSNHEAWVGILWSHVPITRV